MSDRNIEIPIRKVVLLEDRAFVSREEELTLPPGLYTLAVKEVSPVISDKTLQAELKEGSKVSISDCSMLRTVRSEEERDSREPGEIEKQLKELREERRLVCDKKAFQETRIQSSSRINELLYQEMPEDVSLGRELTDETENTAAELEVKIEDASLQVLDLERELQELDQKIHDLEVVYQILQTPVTRYAADILIRIEVQEEAPFTLSLEYQVPLVCWRPRYRAELKGNKLLFSMEGSVWQNTGEDWKDVQLYFSTQRISTETEPPVLVEDELTIQKKPKEEIVEIREQEIQETGGGSSPAASSDELPGIDDCGSIQNLMASGLSTIPSDGFPYRFEISGFETEAETDLQALPELSGYVYIQSRHRNEMVSPILAGPVDLIRESGLAGRTSLLYIASGENFELTWGPDPDLRLYRDEYHSEEKTGALSPWSSVRYSVTIHLSNIGGDGKELVVTERVPVSEVEKVQITFNKEKTSEGCKEPDKNGMVSWSVKLPPRGRKTLELEYSIKKHKAVSQSS